MLPGRDRPVEYWSRAAKEFLRGAKYFLLRKREVRRERNEDLANSLCARFLYKENMVQESAQACSTLI
jgi:hypothetical protein